MSEQTRMEVERDSKLWRDLFGVDRTMPPIRLVRRFNVVADRIPAGWQDDATWARHRLDGCESPSAEDQ